MTTATHLMNELPTLILPGKSPIETLQNYFHTVTRQNNFPSRVFGCECYLHLYPPQTDRPSAKSVKGYNC